MLLSTQAQAQAFLLAVYGGAALGLCYGVLRAARAAFRAGAALTAALDVLFCLCLLAVLLLVVLAATGGEIRGYLVAGLAVGALLYQTAVGRFIEKFFRKVFGSIRAAALRIVAHPLIKRIFR